MPSTFRTLDPQALGEDANVLSQFALDVLVGLSAPRKRLYSKFFYDDRGSDLFTEITRQPEYYLTRCERDILTQHGSDIAAHVGSAPFNLIELGAGDGQKTRVLLAEFLAKNLDFRYVPIDISTGAMRHLVHRIDAEFPALSCEGLVSDYFLGLRWLSSMQADRRNVVLFLGSTIGNFEPAEAQHFLVNLWCALNPGDLVLIGFDLKKPAPILTAAYGDSAGVTREFNLNLLRRINRELGGHFDLETFDHVPTYDPANGRMASFLVSLIDQSVMIDSLGKGFEFEAYEAIHTEFSHKFSRQDIRRLASSTDFEIAAEFLDSDGRFVDSLWRVRRQRLQH